MQYRTSGDTQVDLRRIDTHPDFWYPVAWSHDVKSGKTLGVRFSGEPVVLYRGASGRVFALEDRCAHRQVPLRLGKVEGDTLKCGYHGWAYNCAGRCIDVPYLGSDGLPNGVRSYPPMKWTDSSFCFPAIRTWPRRAGPAASARKSDQRYLTRRLNREVAATTPSCTRTSST